MIGTILAGKYELTGLVGDGPVFANYSAKDVVSGRDVCVRMIKPPFDRHPGFLDAVRESATKYGTVRSQHIESIQEVEADSGHGFMVSDLTRGPSLSDRVRKLAPFSIPVSVATAISICQALEPLHRHRLAHGDMTPQNIAVLANGDVKLQLAGVWEAYSTSPTAGAMVLPGMAPYLAPEVSSGSMPSPSSDVYALGITLFELLTGRMPYYGETSVAIAMQHATSPTPNVRSVNPSVPAVLDEIVKKAMAKNPQDRYPDAGEMLADLRLLQDALRFGRTLSWPLRVSATAAAPQATVKTKAEKTKPDKSPKQQPVAPRMSAIRTDEEYEKETRRASRDRDVPVWVTMIIVFLVAIVLGLIGAWMLMNLNRPKLISVPNVVGLTKQEAREVLKANKLDMKIEASRPNEKVEMDHVTEVVPRAGEKVREGSRVSVVVSSGSQFVTVPDLRGVTVDKARTILGNLGLELDPEMIKSNDDGVATGLVVRSVPSAKSKTERASRVKLVVSIGPGETGARDLPTEGGYLYTIRLGLDDLTEPTTVKIEMEDEEGTREIFQEERNSGDRVEVSAIGKGKKATFHIYYNDRLVKSVEKAADGESEIR